MNEIASTWLWADVILIGFVMVVFFFNDRPWIAAI